jgi:hypothetical protein
MAVVGEDERTLLEVVLEIVGVVADVELELVELVLIQYIPVVDDNTLAQLELMGNKIVVVVELGNNIVVQYLDQLILVVVGDEIVVVAFVVDALVDLIILFLPLLGMTWLQ